MFEKEKVTMNGNCIWMNKRKCQIKEAQILSVANKVLEQFWKH